MDLTLILLVVLLVVVVVVFVLALRGERRGENAPAASNAAEQQAPGRPAIAPPREQVPGGGAAAAPEERQQAPAARATSPDQTTTTTTREVLPVTEATAPHIEAPVARQSSEPGDTPMREATRTDDRVIVRGVPLVEPGGPAAETGHAPAAMADASTVGARSVAGSGETIRYATSTPSATSTPPTPIVTTGSTSPVEPAGAQPTNLAAAQTQGTAIGASDVGPPAPPAVAADGVSDAPAPAMELVVQPPTRTGAVMLSVAPQRLPFRLAELLGEQRGLEEAITIAHRRIDDVELGPDPGAAENRVRLAVLRQDLTQKQERLREILFLQDGYRWVQQHMAPDQAPGEG